MKFKEKQDAPKRFKEEYRDGIYEFIKKKEKEDRELRTEYIKGVFKDPEKYRADFKAMLGYPLSDKREDAPKAEEEFLFKEDDFSVYRMRFEIIDGVKMTGLLFKKNDNKKRPMVIAQHGGQGTPEKVADMIEGEACDNYNHMIERILKYDVNVFAPQLLLWFVEKYGAEYDRNAIDAQLKRVGSSITAFEIYGIERIMDYFEKQDYVTNFGMIGLSYGGHYSLFTAAADTRIKSVISCSYFSERDKYPWVNWTWENAAKKFCDAEIAALVYPRRLCIEIGDKDQLFDVNFGKAEFERLKEISSEVGTNWLDFIAFDGVHEFFEGDEPIKRLVEDIT